MPINPVILIYSDVESKTCTGELSIALKKTFDRKRVAIVQTDRHHFIRNLKELNPSIIILPEIKGEESFYNRHINQETRVAIKSHVDNGAMLVTFCAASYWMGQVIMYSPGQGQTKFRKGEDVFNAVALNASGPVEGYWRASNNQENLGGCHVVPVIVKTKNGCLDSDCWYGNGPEFFSSAGHLPNNIEVLAKYSKFGTIAAFSAKSGRGSYLVSGPLPHYQREDVKANNLLWRVMTHRMHQQLFEKSHAHVLKATP